MVTILQPSVPYKNKITIDYEISYFGFDFDRKSQNLELCQPAPWLLFGKNGKVSDQTART